jgi:hypothetical protein
MQNLNPEAIEQLIDVVARLFAEASLDKDATEDLTDESEKKDEPSDS